MDDWLSNARNQWLLPFLSLFPLGNAIRALDRTNIAASSVSSPWKQEKKVLQSDSAFPHRYHNQSLDTSIRHLSHFFFFISLPLSQSISLSLYTNFFFRDVSSLHVWEEINTVNKSPRCKRVKTDNGESITDRQIMTKLRKLECPIKA